MFPFIHKFVYSIHDKSINFQASAALLWQKEASDIVTYHLTLSCWYFHILPSVIFFQAKVYASTLILLRDILGKTSWNDRHILLFYKKFHFCHLLPSLLHVSLLPSMTIKTKIAAQIDIMIRTWYIRLTRHKVLVWILYTTRVTCH